MQGGELPAFNSMRLGVTGHFREHQTVLFAFVQDLSHFFDGEHTAEGYAARRSVSGRVRDFLFLRFRSLVGAAERVRGFRNGD